MAAPPLAVDRASEHLWEHQASSSGTVRRRIWIISDDLSGPPDEGVKKFTLALAACLHSQHDVELISTRGAGDAGTVRMIPAPRSFLSRSLRVALRAGRPELVVYATRRSATFFSILRARLLKLYCPTTQIVLLGLQTRRHSRWQQPIVRRLRPDLIVVQSDDNCDYLTRLGCRAAIVPSGVDVETFRPVDQPRRVALREQYGLSPDRPIVLHVGHLHEGRGIRDLLPLAASGRCQVVLVTSTSTLQEARLAGELRAAGVHLMTDFLSSIEEIYQLADCYVFPVQTTDNAIEAPLSVLEALACDLPVVTTRFGGLPRLFGKLNHPGLVFVDSTTELTARALELAQRGERGTRSLALPLSWTRTTEALLFETFTMTAPST